ncbi:SNF2 family N-terminal domain-containing protein [Xylaria castorea]|nr:SNF2 family N-terminal domain-containing protein [Xylaria castorea]
MKTSLHAHQVIGTSWMLGRELCETDPRGGILADEMGMGKTLETLACIVSNRPTEDDTKIHAKATLIIAPAIAIKQWEEEIRRHVDTEYINTILHYKQSKDIPIEFLKVADVILASYQEMVRHFPSKKLKAQLQNNSRSEQEYQKSYKNKLGLLFQIPFWRVVLDEGHSIKNIESQTSIACQNLTGRHRWALSGTPITNSLDELYPYLKFLKVNGVGGLKEFQSLYSNTEDATAMNRLDTMMRKIMIRRTMSDRFMSRPLYEIPKPHYDVRHVRLTKEERIIYGVVEERLRGVVNDVLEEVQGQGREVQAKDLRSCLLLFSRLRQGVAHPFLLEVAMKKDLKPEDLLKIKRGLQEVDSGLPVFERIGKWCAKKATAVKDEKDQEHKMSGFGNSQFGYKFNMDRQLDLALASQKEDVCRVCYQEPINPQTATCKHVFCRDCLEDHLRDEFKGGRMIPMCPDCDKSLTLYDPAEQSDTEYSDTQGFKKHPKLNKSQSKFLRQCDQVYPEPVVPSAKTTAVKEAILEWQSEAPGDKIILFVEFKMTCAILGRMLEAEGIPFLYLLGNMSPAKKENTIQGFKEKSEIKVMIVSIRCGSVALNLTVANRVIIVDLWWNLAIEMQAFARVFRIGQGKETHFLRIVADNTIDNRMEALQEEKKENISRILEPGEKRKLSAEEILSLFGNVRKSVDGSLEVLPDDEDDTELDDGSEEPEEADEAEGT